MPCGCKGSNGATRPSNSIYPLALASYPDCTQRYEGEFQSERLWVIGVGDPAIERLFRNQDARAAMAYSKEHRAEIRSTRAVALCAAAVEELVGAS